MVVLKHFSGTGLKYLNEELPWEDWWPLLVVALEAEEMARRANYLGKPEKYEPFFAPGEVGRQSAPSKVVDKILAFAGGEKGARRLWMDQVAQWRPDLVKEAYQRPDGTFVDAEGSPIPAPAGYTFVPDASGQGQEPPSNPVIDSLFGSREQP